MQQHMLDSYYRGLFLSSSNSYMTALHISLAYMLYCIAFESNGKNLQWFFRLKGKFLCYKVRSRCFWITLSWCTPINSENLRGVNCTQVICIIWNLPENSHKHLRNLTLNACNFPKANVDITSVSSSKYDPHCLIYLKPLHLIHLYQHHSQAQRGHCYISVFAVLRTT